MCNPSEVRDDGCQRLAVQGVQAEPYEISRASFVERVCEFLDRYAIALR